MSNNRTTLTITPIEPDILLKKVWASKLDMDTYNKYIGGTEVPLTEAGIQLLKEVMADGWEPYNCTVDLEKEVIIVPMKE